MDDLGVAFRLADLADKITMSRFQGTRLHVDQKPDRSLVSDVDIDVEQTIISELGRIRPDDAVLTEESSGSAGSPESHRCWIIDPLDHTNNYVRGIPFFATLIALEAENNLMLGLISAPALGRRWWAVRGQGAMADGEPIRVSSVDDVAESYFSFAALHLWRKRDLIDQIADLAATARYTYGSGGFWNHMLVAEGRLDISADPWGEPWDLAAVAVIVEEAGGKLTDLAGKARLDSGEAVVTNGRLHGEVLAKLAGATPRRKAP